MTDEQDNINIFGCISNKKYYGDVSPCDFSLLTFFITVTAVWSGQPKANIWMWTLKINELQMFLAGIFNLIEIYGPFPVYSRSHIFTYTNKKVRGHSPIHSPPSQFSGGKPRRLSPVSCWWCRINREDEECCSSVDALLGVWSRTKAVLARAQLVMDAISLFKTLSSPQ